MVDVKIDPTSVVRVVSAAVLGAICITILIESHITRSEKEMQFAAEQEHSQLIQWLDTCKQKGGVKTFNIIRDHVSMRCEDNSLHVFTNNTLQ